MTATAPPTHQHRAALAVEARLAVDRRRRTRSGGELALGAAVVIAAQLVLSSVGGFPESWAIPLADWIDDARRWVINNQTTHWSFSFFFNPVSDSIDWGLRTVERFLLWLP